MLEAKLSEGNTLKKLIDSIRDVVENINFDCNPKGISMQAMDTSHVALVTLHLQQDGFEYYRCDKPLTLGINIATFSKVLKCSSSDDAITLRAEDDPSFVTIILENKSNSLTRT